MTKRDSPKLISGRGIALILGCNGLIIFGFVLGALFIGLWLGERLGATGLAIIVSVSITIPVCLILVTRLTLAMVRWLTPPED